MDDDGVYGTGVGTHVLWHTCREQRTTCLSKYLCACKTVWSCATYSLRFIPEVLRHYPEHHCLGQFQMTGLQKWRF